MYSYVFVFFFISDIMTLECCFFNNLWHLDCHEAQCLKSDSPSQVASGQPIPNRDAQHRRLQLQIKRKKLKQQILV